MFAILVVLFYGFLNALFFAAGCNFVRRGRKINENSRRLALESAMTRGEIVAWRAPTDGPTHPIVRATLNGRIVQFEAATPRDKSQFPVGSAIAVRYSRADPTLAAIEPLPSRHGGTGTIALGIGICALGGTYALNLLLLLLRAIF